MKAVILAVSLSLPLSFSVASAQLTKMTVGYSAMTSAHLPAWLAKEAGIFVKNGLAVQIVYVRAGTTVMMALLSKETPISQVGGSAIVSASLRGADAVMIAGGTETADAWLMSRPEIKTAEQLKGGSVAISVFGGTADSFTRIALKRLGLTPAKDVAIVQIGGLPERLSALETAKVQATILFLPDVFIAQKLGFYTLVHVSLPYQTTSVAVLNKTQYEKMKKENDERAAKKGTSPEIADAFANMFKQLFSGFMRVGENDLAFVINDPNSTLVDIEINDEHGVAYKRGNRLSSEGIHILSFDRKIDEKAQLVIFLATPKSITKVPLMLKDILLP